MGPILTSVDYPVLSTGTVLGQLVLIEQCQYNYTVDNICTVQMYQTLPLLWPRIGECLVRLSLWDRGNRIWDWNLRPASSAVKED